MYFDDSSMKEALDQAMHAFSCQEVPVGVIIVNRLTKEVAVRAHNMVESDNNPIFHAELLAINRLCKILRSKNLSHYDMYVTLEPCAMCAAAISFARIGRLFYGASDSKMGGVESGVRFFTNSSCHHRPEIYPGIMALESAELIKQFFAQLR